MHFYSSLLRYRYITTCGIALLGLFLANAAQADFAIVGDISINGSTQSLANIIDFNNGDGVAGTGDTEGGTVNSFIIGDTATGGLLADGAAPFLGTLEALESDNVIIGNQEGSIGAANIEDFFFGANGNWAISGDLVVGHAGIGYLDLLNAAGIGSSPSTSVGDTIYVGGIGTDNTSAPVIGDESLGQGIVRVNGLGSRLQANGSVSLVVGGSGVGVVEASGRSSINTVGIANIGSTGARGDGTVRLTDLGTRWVASDAVNIGGALGASHGKVEINNEAVLQIDGDSSGSLTINPRGRIELAGGTLRMLPQAGGPPLANPVVNNGLILGDGFIDGGINIGTTGEVRNAAGLANEREYLLVSEAVENNGTIQSLGGAMDFEALVTNNLEIVARDAELHFRAGVSNATNGIITIGGNTTIHGNIANDGGDIFVLSGSESLMVGDLTFTGSSILGLTAGPAAGTLDVTGAIALDSTIIALDYSAGVFPQAGDTYQILHANDGIGGTVGNPASTSGNPLAIGQASAGGVLWDIINTGSTLLVESTGLPALSFGADFNGDGIVNELDLIVWENNFGNSGNPGDLGGIGDADGDGDVDGMDFFLIQRDFGMAPLPPLSALATVPEPATMVMGLMALVCCPRRRSRG